MEEAKARILRGAPSGGTREEARRFAKEEQFIKEYEKKEADKLKKEEEAAVLQGVKSLKTLIAGLREKAKKQGENVRNWFGLFDADKSRSLDLGELAKVLQHAGVRLPEADVAQLFRLLDKNNDKTVSYTEFCDVIEGKDLPED